MNNNSEMYYQGFRGIGLILTGLFLSLLFGWKQGWEAAREIWCPPTAEDAAHAKADRILQATEELEREPHVSIARRFLAGDMDADIELLGKRAVVKIIGLRAGCVDVCRWTDKKLMDEIRSHGPSEYVSDKARNASERAFDFAQEGVILAM